MSPLASQTARALRTFSLINSKLQNGIGRSLSWLCLAMTLTISAIIACRFLLDIGSTAAQETVTYMHATLFMLCLAFAAQSGAHVRVDIFYRRFSAERKAWIDLIGNLIFLLPFSLFITLISWHWALQSWGYGEGSINPGGLPFVYLLKTLVPLTGLLLTLQALADTAQKLIAVSFDDHKNEHTA